MMPAWVLGSQGFGPGMSALNPASPIAGRISSLWWFMLAVSVVVYILVIMALFYGAFRRRREGNYQVGERPPGRRTVLTISVAVGLTVVTLFVFLAFSFTTGRALTDPPKRARLITLIGHQWWWEITYESDTAVNIVSTANELHVPAGEPVVLRMTSRDVIHSFWVPPLNGKRDMIPGYYSSTWFTADTPGVYRGQCAEFCGYQHAKMALLVIAQPKADFERWLDLQRRPASTPSDSVRGRGQTVFTTTTCVMCHSIRGTTAASRVGPDLTHVGGRYTIAAGALHHTPGNLASWITDPQGIKPGTQMPATQLSASDLNALVRYLEGLE